MKNIFLFLVLCSAICFGQTEFNAIKLKNTPSTINDTLQIDLLVREKSGINKGMVRKTSWQYLLSLFNVPSLSQVLNSGNTSNESIHLHSDIEGMSYYHSGLSYNNALSNKFTHIRFKTPVANTTCYWPAKTVNDTIATVGDVKLAVAKSIPLDGTISGSAVTGDLQFSGNRQIRNGAGSQYTSMHITDSNLSSYAIGNNSYSAQSISPTIISKSVYTSDGLSSFSMGPGGISMGASSGGNNVGMSVNTDKIAVNSSDPNFRGLSSDQDYTGNISNLDYVQKKYVDEAISAATPGASDYLPYSGAVADLNMGVGRKLKTDSIEATEAEGNGRIRFFQGSLPGTIIDCSTGSSFGAVLTVNNRLTFNSPYLQVWQLGGSNVATVNHLGSFSAKGIQNVSSIGNANIELTNSGTVITRTLGGVPLTVQNTNISSASNLLEVKSGSSTVFIIDKNGLPTYNGVAGITPNNLVKYSQLQTTMPSLIAITSNQMFATTNFKYIYSFTGAAPSTGILPATTLANSGKSYTLINNGTVPFTVNSNTGGNDIRFRGGDYASFIIHPGGQATFIMDASRVMVYEPTGVSNSINNGDTYNAVTSGAVYSALNLKSNKVGTDDIEVTDSSKGIILRSPNGNRWRTTVSDSGVLTTVLIP